ncbi:MAG TPA: hypothetical protein VMX17_07235, partial [Candidatus Glassbacteria bacterium]|nr:hypothetical protein [Candidatus Glassbacteria bacterium]
NPELQKRASMLDDIMMTIAADSESQRRYKEDYDRKIEEIKRKANQPVASKKAEDSKKKTLNPNEGSLLTRYCPDHVGVQLYRQSETERKCPVDGKIYNYSEGFTTEDGTRNPGGTVEGQTQLDSFISNPLPYGEAKDK